MTRKQQKILRDIFTWYPIGFDVEDSKHSRAQYAEEKTGLDYHVCYRFFEKLLEDRQWK